MRRVYMCYLHLILSQLEFSLVSFIQGLFIPLQTIVVDDVTVTHNLNTCYRI